MSSTLAARRGLIPWRTAMSRARLPLTRIATVLLAVSASVPAASAAMLSSPERRPVWPRAKRAMAPASQSSPPVALISAARPPIRIDSRVISTMLSKPA